KEQNPNGYNATSEYCNMTNIAVVVFDALRYDVFNQYFDWLDGIRFENAYATSHWTIPSHASLFTGHYPREIGTYGEYPSLDYPNTIAEKLNNSGYKTRMFTNNPQLLIYEGWVSGFDQSIGRVSKSFRTHLQRL